SWLDAPARPALWRDRSAVRTDDMMAIRLAAFADGQANPAEGTSSWFGGGFTPPTKRFADGAQLLPRDYANGSLPSPAGAQDYRLEYVVDNASPWAALSTHTSAVWTFQSSQPESGQTRIEPLLTVDYDLDVDLNNRLIASAKRNGPLTL